MVTVRDSGVYFRFDFVVCSHPTRLAMLILGIIIQTFIVDETCYGRKPLLPQPLRCLSHCKERGKVRNLETPTTRTRPPHTWSAYHLYENFGEKFPSNGTGIFLATENRHGIELYHVQNTGKFFTFSRHEACMALVIQTNGTENFGRFGKNGKKVIPRKILLFLRKISTGMNRSIWILPGISEFSIQMTSAHVVLTLLRSPNHRYTRIRIEQDGYKTEAGIWEF